MTIQKELANRLYRARELVKCSAVTCTYTSFLSVASSTGGHYYVRPVFDVAHRLIAGQCNCPDYAEQMRLAAEGKTHAEHNGVVVCKHLLAACLYIVESEGLIENYIAR